MGLINSISNFISDISSDLSGKRKPQIDLLITELKSVEDSLVDFTSRMTGYVSLSEYKELLDKSKDVDLRCEKELRTFRFFRGSSYNVLNLAYQSFQEALQRFTVLIQQHNDYVLKQKISQVREVIGKVEGQDLDSQQMACIVKEVHSHLVIAGAGTGKTTTIIGKVKYLLGTGLVQPQEFLILSFTNAAASEMRERLLKETNQKIYVATFHKLGYDIIRHAEHITPKISQLDMRTFVLDELKELSKQGEYEKKLRKYLLHQSVQEENEFAFESMGEYQDYLQSNPPTTLLGERVKSYGEMHIANYLLEHGVKYDYEAEYPADTRTEEFNQYYPDFFLPDYGVYIEYFGINRKGEVPSYWEGKDGKTATEIYQESMMWKRNLHKEHETTLIELFAYENMEGSLLETLETRLRNAGIPLREKNLDELFEATGQSKKNVFSTLAETMSTVITLSRNKRYSAEHLLSECSKTMPKQIQLAELIEPVFNDYECYLRKTNTIDFTDMLHRAEDLTQIGDFVHKFKYVIVDEYQDISASQYSLLNAMRQQADYTLFCVGDDWQSIYRFAGSDIGYILNFSHYWTGTELSRIQTTYRFSQRLIDISGRFIMRNPNQIKKYIRSGNDSTVPVLGHIYANTEKGAIGLMVTKLEELPKNTSVFLIGIFFFDADLLKEQTELHLSFDTQRQTTRIHLDRRNDLTIYFYTAHRSKGLQADYVFIINNRATRMGFPSKVVNPPLVEMLLEQYDQFTDAEERRLFYVALTRAKKKVFLITTKKNVSSFAQEIIENEQDEIKRERWSCPWCGEQLRKINGPYGDFYGCSNYRITGCRYKKIINN